MKKTVFAAAVFCLVCLCVTSAPAHASSISNSHNSFIFLTAVHETQTVSCVLVNSILNDFTEFHIFWILTAAGTVDISISPASYGDFQYVIAGFLGLTPITGYGIYGSPIDVEVTVPVVGLGFIVMATQRTSTALFGTDGYPVTFNMDMSLTPATTTTTI